MRRLRDSPWLAVAVLLFVAGACLGETDERAATTFSDAEDETQLRQQTCTTARGSPSSDRDAPLTAELCVSSSMLGVGEPVTVTLTAKDPDAAIAGLTECAPHTVTFGDEEEVCFNEAACAESEEPPLAAPGILNTSLTHTYESSGNYTVRAVLSSGDLCPNVFSSTATLSVDVLVD